MHIIHFKNEVKKMALLRPIRVVDEIIPESNSIKRKLLFVNQSGIISLKKPIFQMIVSRCFIMESSTIGMVVKLNWTTISAES